ncbi:hypothetical protein [Thermophilibacter sp.]
MATVTIDFGILDTAVKRSNDVANELDDYADAFPSRISRPLGSLTGGSSGYTSTAATLAAHKVTELRGRAEQYRAVAQRLSNFSDSARKADTSVKDRLEGVVEKREKGLSWWDKIATTLFRVLNDVLGDDVISQLVRDILNIVDSFAQDVIKGVKAAVDWFKHGDGRYLLEGLTSILGAVSAVLVAIAAFPASGFALLMAGLAVFVAADKVLDAIATTVGMFKAWGTDDSEPGLARYHGSVTSYTKWAEHSDAPQFLKDALAFTSKAADVAEIVLLVGNLFSYRGVKTTTAEDGSTTVYKNPSTRRRVYQNKYSFDRQTLEMNLKKQFGWKPEVYKKGVNTGRPKLDSNGNMKGSYSIFNFGLPKGSSYSPDKYNEINSWVSYGKRAFSTVKDVTRVDENFSRGNIVSGLEDVTKLVFSDFSTGIKAPGSTISTYSTLERLGVVPELK